MLAVSFFFTFAYSFLLFVYHTLAWINFALVLTFLRIDWELGYSIVMHDIIT